MSITATKPATPQPAAPTPPQAGTHAAVQQTPQGRVYNGPVQVQNRMEWQVRAKVAIEDLASEVTVLGVDLKKRQIYSEAKIIKKSSAVDGNDTGLRAGLADNGNRLGSTSPTRALRPVAKAMDAMGVHQFFSGLQLFRKTENGVYQNKLAWKGGGSGAETSDVVEKSGVKLIMTGDVDIAGVKVKGTVDAIELAREKKGSTGNYTSVIKSTVKGLLVATDQYQLPELSKRDRRILPDGRSVDVSKPADLAAYEQSARAGAKTGDMLFHFQQASAGASNVAIDVPDLAAKGSNLVPVDAIVAHLRDKARTDPKAYGDLAGIRASDLLTHNAGRVHQMTSRDANGKASTVNAFDKADIINLGYATLQGVQGVVRAPNLKEGAVRGDYEFFFSHAKGTAAGAIAPSAVKADGTIDKKQVAARIGVDTLNGVGETLAQAGPALVEGGLKLGSALVTGISKLGAAADQKLIDGIKARHWDQTSIGRTAVVLLEKDKKSQDVDQIAKGLDDASAYMGGVTKALGNFYYKHAGSVVEGVYGNKYDAKAIEAKLVATHAPKRDEIALALKQGQISLAEAEKRFDTLKAVVRKDHSGRLEEAAFDPRFADHHPIKGLTDRPIHDVASTMPVPKPAAPAVAVAPAKSAPQTRLIREGDTLWGYWKEQSAVSWQDYRAAIHTLNPQLKEDGRIRAGQKINLP